MFLLFLLGVISLCGGQAPQESQIVMSFDSDVYPVGECSDEYVDASELVCETFNESISFMHGKFVIKKDIDDLICEIILKKEASGKHEVVFSLDICDLCTELSKESSEYKPVLKHLAMPSECPIKAGEIIVDQLTVNTDEFGIKDTQCGKYLAEIIVSKRTGENCKDRVKLFHLVVGLLLERSG